MCIECWWGCLNELQQAGLGIVVVLWLTAGTILLSIWADGSYMKPVKWEWIVCAPALVFWVGVVLFAAVAILYGLYGAIACLF